MKRKESKLKRILSEEMDSTFFDSPLFVKA